MRYVTVTRFENMFFKVDASMTEKNQYSSYIKVFKLSFLDSESSLCLII